MSIESDVVPRLPFVDLEAQQRRLRPAIDAALARVLDRGTYLMGPEVDELEEALAARVGVAHAVACSSGTDALVLALMALGVGPGTAVVVPTFTFVATAEAVVLAGATPLFADAAGPGGNMGPREVEAAIAAGRAVGHDPVGVVAVDLFGHPADHAGIERAAGGRWVVVDGAQSYGAARDGRPVGSTGVATTTSFYPAKPLGGYGDGGAILTADGALADVLRSLRSHGQGTDRYDAVRVGMNGRLDTLQAAVLLQKLTVFDDELARRREVAARYHDGLHGLVTLPAVAPGSEPSWAQYTVEDGDRDALAAALDRAGVPTAVHYPRPLHRQGGYGDHPRAPSLAEAERLCAVVLSLPMHPYLAPADQDRIVAAVREARGVSGATIHPSADVDPGATVGDDTQVWNWSKVREGARIGAGCRIGQSVYIDHHVVVGDGCKVQNGVSVYAGVTLGDHVFVGPSATFTNDRVPRAAGDDEWEVVPTVVGDHASIGANATIVCGVRLGRACMVGAGSVVTHDVPPFALVVGNPARVLDYVDLAGQRRFVGPRGGPEET